MENKIIQGDSLEVLKTLPENSVDACITDPPYGIGFMGKAWDKKDIERVVKQKLRKGTLRPDGYKQHHGQAFAAGTYNTSLSGNRVFQDWTEEWAREVFRVLKPGAHLLSFASTRTYHRMASGVEEAGFEIRDQIGWTFGSGFPKSHNLKGEWQGWGTALKPAWEPIVLARKPFKGTVAQNVLKWRTGGLNIEISRIKTSQEEYEKLNDGRKSNRTIRAGEVAKGYGMKPQGLKETGQSPLGRWPANLIHDGSEEVLAGFPNSKAGKNKAEKGTGGIWAKGTNLPIGPEYGDDGSAARFFFKAEYDINDLLCLMQKRDKMNVWKTILANNVKKLLETIQATIEGSAPENVREWQKEQNVLIAKYVEKNAELCEMYIALVVAKIKNLVFKTETLQVIRDSIGNSKECTQILNLVLNVAGEGNTDTTQIMTNLLKLFGYVQDATDENINLEKKGVVVGNGEPRRFLYIPKTSASERNAGLDNPSTHPTVKPLALMTYLIKLITPPKGIVLDPFAGSGSTLVAAKQLGHPFIGIEKEAEYVKIAEARINAVPQKLL